MIKRRDFLRFSMAGLASAAAGATGMAAWVPRAEAATINKTFYITEGIITQITGEDVYFMGFSSSPTSLNIPGESFIVMEGDTVNITIINTLGTSHSFAIDGQVDSGTIAGGASKTVTFTAKGYGSFMYYDKLNSPYNYMCGLHGGMGIMPSGRNNQLYPGSPTFVQQQFWVFHDIDPAWNAKVQNRQIPSSTYTPRYFTLNGLGGRPPGAPGNGDPNVDNMHDPRSALHGSIGDRTLIRVMNAGKCMQAVHTHANHMEWLSSNGKIRSDIWKKDIIPLDGNRGRIDVIFPFERPSDAYPSVSKGTYPMHLHTEMSQTAGGGFYMFGSMTDIYFE